MSGHILESSGRWRATAEYHGSRGPSTAYLMDDGLIAGSHYWLVATEHCQWPSRVSAFDPSRTARMIEAGKMRLVKGQWPDVVLNFLAMAPDPQCVELALPESHRLV